MSTEELLKPRYKVIDGFWNSPFKIGDIINFDLYSDGVYRTCIDGLKLKVIEDFDYFPHLFKKLEWCEDRKVEDMPEYVKIPHYPNGENDFEIINVDGDFVKHHFTEIGYFGLKFKNESGLIYSCFSPATEQEYNQYIQTKPQTI